MASLVFTITVFAMTYIAGGLHIIRHLHKANVKLRNQFLRMAYTTVRLANVAAITAVFVIIVVDYFWVKVSGEWYLTSISQVITLFFVEKIFKSVNTTTQAVCEDPDL